MLKVSTEHDPLKDLKLGSYLGNSELNKDRENTNLMATIIAWGTFKANHGRVISFMAGVWNQYLRTSKKKRVPEKGRTG